jgi:predicted RNA-binding protein with PUA-like domain
MVPLNEIRAVPELQNMKLIQKGQRLSIQPVTANEFQTICALGRTIKG